MLMNPNYPVYIVSKGRWESRLTSKALEEMKMPYSIVIEPQEYENYASVIDPSKILILPFSNLGQGSIPARNWIWEHSISIGAKSHWILDDNIRCFNRLNRNFQVKVTSGTIFKCAEDFVDRYENIAIAGFNYDFFVQSKVQHPPYIMNTRIYSCTLIRNDIPYRWRGKYNEDTDLSLRALKDGYCTVQFNTFLQEKAQTLTMKGGNTDVLYANGTLEKSQALVDFHPDVAKVVWKFNRWHHYVDYRAFKKNRLLKKEGLVIPNVINDYGMKLI
jgi:hypothetical protein